MSEPGPRLHRMSLFKRLLGRDPSGDVEPVRPVGDGGAGLRRVRLNELAAQLREAAAGLAAALVSVTAREEQLRRSVEEYDRIAQSAIANGRTIQAESAIASSEAAEAALTALAPQARQIGDLRDELERVALELERQFDTSPGTVAQAEERARQLAQRARELAAPHRRGTEG